MFIFYVKQVSLYFFGFDFLLDHNVHEGQLPCVCSPSVLLSPAKWLCIEEEL